LGEKAAFEGLISLKLGFRGRSKVKARRRRKLKGDSQALYHAYLEATELALQAAGLKTRPAFTRLIFAALDGLVFQQLIFGEASNTDESIDELRQIFKRL